MAHDSPGELDAVWKALSDPTRRAILDLLRSGPRGTTDIVEAFPRLTRFGVMKHIDVLRNTGLIHTREEGRQRVNSLNAVPIRRIYERWVSLYQEFWADKLLRLEEDFKGSDFTAEALKGPADRPAASKRVPKKTDRKRQRGEKGET